MLSLIRESVECEQELKDSLGAMDGSSRQSAQEQVGAIYKVWAGSKSLIRGDDSKLILASCEREIDAVRHAYETAISQSDGMDDVIRARMRTQLMDMQSAEERIREYQEAL